MKYRIFLEAKIWTEIEEAYRWISEQSPRQAARWFNGLQKTIDSLEEYPTRCRMAPEGESFGLEIRQLLYGKRRHAYRILFVIHEDTVRVLSIRHSARDYMKPEDLS